MVYINTDPVCIIALANEPNYFGNDFTRVAVVNWAASQDPIRLEEMHIGVNTYFNKGKDSYYFAQTSAMSFAKSKIMNWAFEHAKPSESSANAGKAFGVIDCAAGKGQDLNRYINAGVTNLLAMDIDKVALAELVTRYYEKVHDRRKSINMQINIIPQDMTEQHSKIVEKIKNIWKRNGEFVYPNMIVCNLAIHYFTRNIVELKNFVSFAKAMMQTGSVFMYTTFGGEKIFNLLTQHNGEWLVQTEGAVRYRIVRKYTGQAFMDFGQTIQVKLPFTGDDLYEENLVNTNYINFIFKQHGINVVKSGFMDEFLPALQAENPQIFKMLTEDDKKFIGLYSYNILKA